MPKPKAIRTDYKKKRFISPDSLASAKRKALPAEFLGTTPRDSLAYSDKLSELLRGFRPALIETSNKNQISKPIPAPRLSLQPLPAPQPLFKPIPAPRLKTLNKDLLEKSFSLPNNIVTPYDNIVAAAEKIQQTLLNAIHIMSVKNQDLLLSSQLSHVA